MILNPAILALLLGSALLGLTATAATSLGAVILARWNLRSGSALQLNLERRTYLVSAALSLVMAYQAASFFLFMHTGEELHELFVGAMCAVGVFKANDYGYPTLLLKFANALLCIRWLILNHADNLGHDYPLIRRKYAMLFPIAGLLLLEAVLQYNFFARLAPDLITSCCGTLFSEDSATLAGDLAHLPWRMSVGLFYAAAAFHLRTGYAFLRTGGHARLFGLASLAMLGASVVAVISFISVGYYQIPTHHCPFCLLQPEYGYVGYPIYLALLAAPAAGTGVSMLARHTSVPSLAAPLPRLMRRLVLVSMAATAVLALLAALPFIFSDFRLG